MGEAKRGGPAVTSGQLHKVLTRLGFTRWVTLENVIYRQAKQNARIVVPILGSGSKVDPEHISAVYRAVTGKGVATTEELTSLFTRTAAPAPPVAHKQVDLGGKATGKNANEQHGNSSTPDAKRSSRSTKTPPAYLTQNRRREVKRPIPKKH